jgi:hypothetical protein
LEHANLSCLECTLRIQNNCDAQIVSIQSIESRLRYINVTFDPAQIWYPSDVRLTFSIMVCLGLVATSRSEPIEITGLVDFGGVHMAFVMIGNPGQPATLHPGEKAGDVMLRDFNAREGWAVFMEGTNESKVWLHYSANTQMPAQSPLLPNQSRAQLPADPEGMPNPLTIGQMTEVSAALETKQVRDNYALPPDAPMTPWLQSYLDTKQTPRVSDPGRQTSTQPGESAPKAAAPPSETASPTERVDVGSPSLAAATVLNGGGGMAANPNQPVIQAPTENSDPNPAAAPPSAATTDAAGQSAAAAAAALRAEGEYIRGFYGMQAFFAWDMAHRDR